MRSALAWALAEAVAAAACGAFAAIATYGVEWAQGAFWWAAFAACVLRVAKTLALHGKDD